MKRICIQETVNTFNSHHLLPCDPIALVERLDILMASKAAGNTSVRNDFLVSVCDELLREKLIDKHKYKIIMLQL